MLCTLGSASSRDSRVSSGLLVAAFCVPATTSSRFLACGNGPAPPPCQGTALRSTCSTARADDGPFCLCCRGSSRFALAARLLLEVAGLADWAVATAGVVVPMSSLETMGGRSRSKFPSLCCQSTRVDAMSTCLELMSGASITTTSSSMIGLPLAADDLRLRDSFLPEGFASLFTETRSPLEVQMTSKSQRQRGHLTLLPRDATCAHWSKQVVWKVCAQGSGRPTPGAEPQRPAGFNCSKQIPQLSSATSALRAFRTGCSASGFSSSESEDTTHT
mmetsp:Transcript_9220/g.34634  ORF Transcript_9220/g.34634 Transcript_9220/m.34634 type:complete len:275 (+) Transcript_9220:414-1238(+)